MAELNKVDIIKVHNPTKEKFLVRFNGEPYTIEGEETKTFSYNVGLHLAKHLSDKIVAEENPPQLKKNPTEREISREETRVSQLKVFDNPKRRIALYRILEDTLRVQDVILNYNFKGFVGEMDIYKDFVTKHGDKFIEKDLSKKRLTDAEKLAKLEKEMEELKALLVKPKEEEKLKVGRPKKEEKPEEVKPIPE